MGRLITKGYEEAWWKDGNVLCLIAVLVTQLYAFIRTHKMAHFLYVRFIMYKLYLKKLTENIQKVQIDQRIKTQSNILLKK